MGRKYTRGVKRVLMLLICLATLIGLLSLVATYKESRASIDTGALTNQRYSAIASYSAKARLLRPMLHIPPSLSCEDRRNSPLQLPFACEQYMILGMARVKSQHYISEGYICTQEDDKSCDAPVQHPTECHKDDMSGEYCHGAVDRMHPIHPGTGTETALTLTLILAMPPWALTLTLSLTLTLTLPLSH